MRIKESKYNKNLYINSLCPYININVIEGGSARDYAFMHWIESSIDSYEEIMLTTNKIKNIYKIFFALISQSGFNIIFQYPRIGLPIFTSTIISHLFLALVKLSSKKNDVVFDISDIKHEQLIDLEIKDKNMKKIKTFENMFFRLPIKFIFASYSMRDYICKKYLVDRKNTDVCINGGIENSHDMASVLEKHIQKNNVNYIYAGTLNKGRQIEKMILNFPNDGKHNLLLMGTDGEWINGLDLPNNINYLGPIEQKEAHYLASKCDIGLIPYDESKLYYNLAYPTKLSFYITAGIPFLSTAVKEVTRINEKYEIGFINEINNWSSTINNITLQEINNKKDRIKNVKENLYWNNIFSKNKFIS